MKKKLMKVLALTLGVMLIMSCLPLTAFAAEGDTELSMTEGDVITGFVPAGTACTSSDTSIAWVDGNGSLNAMKAGTATLSDGDKEYTVTVGDYSDGSEVVGNLKILARYNDSMQFYDGHVYLLFTSYQDDVTVAVNDLYAGYEISDQYYKDIRANLMNGSNHGGNDTEQYFTFSDTMNSVTLDRGEIVTIGMYRDFDMSVPDAALGSIKNSSLWSGIVNAGKAAVVETIFGMFDKSVISADEAFAKFKATLDEIGLDYNKALDGVVDGGVCFNRELYNQKLEWDQYENVTYELDITRNQLNTMQMYLQGNLNKFSILKNSCATVALRAWNAAVGTRNGEDTAYKLSYSGSGIFSLIDAPKSVRDSIVDRLPGYYLNNSEGVAEPDAGFEDQTGWVYVSAPEKVTPISYVYEDDSLVIDESKTKMSSLIKAAKAGRALPYNKDEQEIGVKIRTSPTLRSTNIYGFDFTINGETVSLDSVENGVWLKAEVASPVEGEEYYAVDADGKALPSEYEDGWVSFYAESLPASYEMIGSSEGTKNILNTTVINGDDADVKTEVYIKSGSDKIMLDSMAEVKSGTKVFVKPVLSAAEDSYILEDITFDGIPIYNGDCYDSEEHAYYAVMPSRYTKLTVAYRKALLAANGWNIKQISVGDTLKASDCASVTVIVNNDEFYDSDRVLWKIISDPNGVFEQADDLLTAVKTGEADVWACSESNENIGTLFRIKVYEDTSDMVKVSFDIKTDLTTDFYGQCGEGEKFLIPYSDYLVPKGTAVSISPDPLDGEAVLYAFAGITPIKPNGSVTVNKDTKITVVYADAQIKDMPDKVELKGKGDTYQLSAKVGYTGIYSLLPVYDKTIRYKSSDPLVKVDENGLITVAQEPPKSGKAVYVTAYAGSSNGTVCATTKVVVGAYRGERIVGRLTIWARPIVKTQLVSHGALAFTTYEDLDMDVSFYNYFDPNEKYDALMAGYEQDPSNYSSDPALYNENELGLEDRESYFNTISHGPESEPCNVSLRAGETVSISNYGYEPNNMLTIRKSLETDSLSTSEDAQELIRQMRLYSDGGEIDSVAVFDSFTATLKQIYASCLAYGYNPADGHSEGGLDLNREMFNQFRREDTQLPNNYYTIEITADELAMMRQYICDPQNNYYSLLTMNCATGAVNVWNAALADKPELHLSANYTKIATDPMSLYVELGLLGLKQNLDGESGTDYYPRTVAYSDATREAIAAIASIGEVEYTDECKQRIDAAREAYDALNDAEQARVWNYQALTDAEEAYKALKPKPVIGDANGDGQVDVRDVTAIQRHAAEFRLLTGDQFIAADVNLDGVVNVKDATLLQMYLAEYKLIVALISIG